MLCNVEWQNKRVGQVEAEPECGEDFCDRCGDCLHCYGGEACFNGGEDNGPHVWWVYADEAGAPEWIREDAHA